MRDSLKNYIPNTILDQDFKQGLSQHKFDLENPKYKKFIQEIINEKGFMENQSWDSQKIVKDFKTNTNHGVIWRICKHYLMVEGFKDHFHKNKQILNINEKFNNLKSYS